MDKSLKSRVDRLTRAKKQNTGLLLVIPLDDGNFQDIGGNVYSRAEFDALNRMMLIFKPHKPQASDKP